MKKKSELSKSETPSPASKSQFIDGLQDAMKTGAAAETVQRFGSAVKEHLVSYSAVDHETGQTLKKGLKSISEYKINPDYQEQNIKQQAGFSAEVKSVARKNAERIIRQSEGRVTRTDDIGRVNDVLYDLYELDSSGHIINGSGSQMKFVGNFPKALLDKLHTGQFQKYLDADCFIDVADDDYNALMGTAGSNGIIDEEINKLRHQMENAQRKGKDSLVQQMRLKIEKHEKIKSRLRKSGLTRQEAIEARLHPELSVAKDIVKLSTQAGLEQVKYGAAISGSISIIRNIAACAQGKKTPEKAAESVVVDTGTGAATSFAVAFSGSVIKGGMQNVGNEYVRTLANTNLASSLVTTSLHVGKTLHRYIHGEIDAAECVEQLGAGGVGEIGAAMFSSMGIATIPAGAPMLLSVLGGMAGATFGYTAAVACYRELSDSLKEAKLSREERLIIERECAEAVQMIQEYRAEMNSMVSKYMSNKLQAFYDGFSELDNAIMTNDIDGFIEGNVKIQRALGHESQFSSMDEFDAFMSSGAALKL